MSNIFKRTHQLPKPSPELNEAVDMLLDPEIDTRDMDFPPYVPNEEALNSLGGWALSWGDSLPHTPSTCFEDHDH